MQPSMQPFGVPSYQPSSEPTTPTSQPSSSPSDWVNITTAILVGFEGEIGLKSITVGEFNDDATKQQGFTDSVKQMSGFAKSDDVQRTTVEIVSVNGVQSDVRRLLAVDSGISVKFAITFEFSDTQINATEQYSTFSKNLAFSVDNGTFAETLKAFEPSFSGVTAEGVVLSQPEIVLPEFLRTPAPSGTPVSDSVKQVKLSLTAMLLVLLGLLLLFPLGLYLGKNWECHRKGHGTVLAGDSDHGGQGGGIWYPDPPEASSPPSRHPKEIADMEVQGYSVKKAWDDMSDSSEEEGLPADVVLKSMNALERLRARKNERRKAEIKVEKKVINVWAHAPPLSAEGPQPTISGGPTIDNIKSSPSTSLFAVSEDNALDQPIESQIKTKAVGGRYSSGTDGSMEVESVVSKTSKDASKDGQNQDSENDSITSP